MHLASKLPKLCGLACIQAMLRDRPSVAVPSTDSRSTTARLAAQADHWEDEKTQCRSQELQESTSSKVRFHSSIFMILHHFLIVLMNCCHFGPIFVPGGTGRGGFIFNASCAARAATAPPKLWPQRIRPSPSTRSSRQTMSCGHVHVIQ